MSTKKNFPPYEEAKKRVNKAGIKSVCDYWVKYKELGLPSSPQYTYKDKGWIDWPSFWDKKESLSYGECKRIAIDAGIKNEKDYNAKYKELGLPSHPYRLKEWIDWPSFLGKEKVEFPSYKEAKRRVIEAGIESSRKYKAKYKELGLPCNPNSFYKEEWIDWDSFLEKKEILPYEEFRRSVIENGIKSSGEYLANYKELGLPSDPRYTYKEEWIDWPTFFGRPHKTSHKERATKVLSKLVLNPILLGDKAPLQIIYMLATNMDKELAEEIEILLKMMSCEERLDWVKEQLKTLLVDTPTTSDTSSETLEEEMSAMESMMDVFEDSMDELPDEDITNIKAILENYYHNVINKELIGECDD